MIKMYRINFLILFAMSIIIRLGYTEEIFTLKKCLVFANENNRVLKTYRKEIEKSNEKIVAARSSLYPTINFSSSYNQREEDSGSKSLGLGLSQPLYKGGAISAAIKESKINHVITKEEYNRLILQVFFQTKQFFYNVLQEEAKLNLAEKILTRRKENMTLIRLRYKRGLENAALVSQGEADFYESEFEKKNVEQELRLAKAKLNFILGRDKNMSMKVVEDERLIKFPKYNEIIEKFLNLRPKLKKEIAKEDLLEAQLKKVKSDYYPSISLSASNSWDGEDNIFDNHNSWRIGVNMGFYIFEKFSTKAQVKQSKLNIEIQRENIKQLKEEILIELDEIYLRYELAKEKKKVILKSLEAIRDIFKITQFNYKKGKTSYFILQNYEYDLTRAEYAYIDAHYKLLILQADLVRAIGMKEEL